LIISKKKKEEELKQLRSSNPTITNPNAKKKYVITDGELKWVEDDTSVKLNNSLDDDLDPGVNTLGKLRKKKEANKNSNSPHQIHRRDEENSDDDEPINTNSDGRKIIMATIKKLQINGLNETLKWLIDSGFPPDDAENFIQISAHIIAAKQQRMRN